MQPMLKVTRRLTRPASLIDFGGTIFFTYLVTYLQLQRSKESQTTTAARLDNILNT